MVLSNLGTRASSLRRKRFSDSGWLLSTVVWNYGDVFAYFAGVQAAVARALARRRIISFVKSSRVKVH
jgi:hypothetical protein